MLITAIVLIINVGTVISSLDVYPHNRVVFAGQRMEMDCKANHNEMVNRWTVKRVGRYVEVIFRAKQQTNSSEQQRDKSEIYSNFPYFGVNFLQNGDCILYSNRTELKDAGVYTCFKNEDAVKSSAQLTVLESNPICESSISAGNNNNSVPQDVHFWMQCSVNFSTVGNYPSMKWIQHHGDTQVIRNDSVAITTNTSVTSVLNASIKSTENGSYFSCKTYFKPYNGPVKTTASNIPDFRFIWNSTNIIFQESTLSTDKYLEVKDILMSSDVKLGTSITAALPDSIGTDSSNYWFFVSLSLAAVVSIFFVLMVIMALNFYTCRKRTTTGREDPTHASSFASLDRPMSDEYEIMPYAYTDGYDKIEDINVTDIDTPIQFSRREGPLPTPGYDRLLSRRPGTLTVYSPIDNYEQPMDREDIKKSPESEQHANIDKSFTATQCVKVNMKAYIELISETEEEDSSRTFSTVSIARKEINQSSVTSSASVNKIPSSPLTNRKLNEEATKDDSSEEIPSSYLKISVDVTKDDTLEEMSSSWLENRKDFDFS